jgi:putative ABC transport system permease protein
VRLLRNLRTIFILASQRLWGNWGLMVGMTLGLIVAVALATSIPLYLDGVNERVLQKALATPSLDRRRPPFAFMFRYNGDINGPITWEAFDRTDRYMSDVAPGLVGLPRRLHVSFARTANGRLYPAGASDLDARTPLDWLALGTISDFTAHIMLVDGKLPAPTEPAEGEPLEVLMAQDKADQFGLVAGEEFILVGGRFGYKEQSFQLPLRIAGIWVPTDEIDPYWFYAPTSLDAVLFVDRTAFADRVVPAFGQAGGGQTAVETAVWYSVFDGQRLRANQALSYLGRWIALQTAAGAVLPKLTLDMSPQGALNAYAWTARLLTVLLYVFTLPIIAIVLGFISINAILVIQRQRNEIAVLRSRGTSSLQIVALYLLEGAILGALALAVGPWVGRAMAQAMGQTQSFLTFAPGPPLVIEMTRESLLPGLAALGVALIVGVSPALGAARHTIVTYKQEVVRSLRRPLWQRLYLDLWLVALPLYGYYELKQRGTISFLGRNLVSNRGDPFQNPFFFLVPTLFVFSLALIFIRFFPLLMRFLAILVQPLPEVSPLLALRQLARSWKFYTGPLFLVVLTLGLACFTASMAKTLDLALLDRTYYEVGADLRLVEMGESFGDEGGAGASAFAPAGNQTVQASQDSEADVGWSFLPVSEHTRAPGVLGAARVGFFQASAELGGGVTKGTVLGIDRVDFSRVAYFRRDFAGAPLGTLMNQLARDSSAILVARSFLAEHGLQIGDRITLQVKESGRSVDVPSLIVGVSDYFPMLYPDDGAFFVANLDYLFERLGGERPYDVLLRTAPGSNTDDIVRSLESLDLRIIDADDARTRVAMERQRPERQGLLGLLSVGFLACAALTVLAFLFYAFLSLRQRFIELGMLRAIGLSLSQMIAFLAFEQLILIGIGIAAGTAAGVLASTLFIPFLQVQGGPHPNIPPFTVVVAWGDIFKVYAIFGTMLLAAIAGLARFLAHMRITDAVKLGETV